VTEQGSRVIGTVASVGRTKDTSLVRLATGEVVDFKNIDRIDAPAPTTTTAAN
jgi:hypothetical protein